MAVDVYTENFVDMISPRLSFSRDLEENEAHTINKFSCNLDHSLIDSTFDFAFNVDTSLTFPSSSADELFSDGKMLPTCLKKEEMQKKEVLLEDSIRPCLDPSPTSVTEVRKKSLKEFLEDSSEEEEPNIVAKSFWKFRRSNSLNCDTNRRKGLIGSWKILSRSGSTGKFLEKIMEDDEKPNNNNLHIKFFWKFSRNNSLKCETNEIYNKGSIGSSKILRRSQSTSDHNFSNSGSKHFRRSNSTGSAPNASNGNKLKKQQSQKQQQVVGNGKLSQKGKVKDNNRGYSYGNYNNSNSLRVNSVLNLPSPYISSVSLDLFSFGSLFCNGSRDRKNRK